MTGKERHGRGCDCHRCEYSRAYSRAYHAKKKGADVVMPTMASVIAGRKEGTPPQKRVRGRIVNGTRQPLNQTGKTRLVETETGSALVLHWPPKDETTWQCPQCGRQFAKVDGSWAEVL